MKFSVLTSITVNLLIMIASITVVFVIKAQDGHVLSVGMSSISAEISAVAMRGCAVLSSGGTAAVGERSSMARAGPRRGQEVVAAAGGTRTSGRQVRVVQLCWGGRTRRQTQGYNKL